MAVCHGNTADDRSDNPDEALVGAAQKKVL
jgi:hypothetical protein